MDFNEILLHFVYTIYIQGASGSFSSILDLFANYKSIDLSVQIITE